jgi:hypothetical protein
MDRRTAPCPVAGQAGARVCLQPVLYATLLLCEFRGKERSRLVTLLQGKGVPRKRANCS